MTGKAIYSAENSDSQGADSVVLPFGPPASPNAVFSSQLLVTAQYKHSPPTYRARRMHQPLVLTLFNLHDSSMSWILLLLL